MELVIQSGADAGKVFSVGTTPLVAGRQPGVDILLNDTQVSRRHASFQIINGSLTVTDLGSANGTTLNGQPLAANQPVLFSPGDRLQLGNTTLEVRPSVNSGPPAYSAGTQPAIPRPPEVQGYNQSYNAPPPPAPMPGPVPAPVNPAYNNNYNNAGYAPPNYGIAPAPPVSPVKKGGNGLFLWIGLVVIIAVAAIAVIVILGSGNNNPNGTPVAGPNSSTPSPHTPQANPAGPSGSNALPPPPPAGFGQPGQPRAAWANESHSTSHYSRIVEYNNWRL